MKKIKNAKRVRNIVVIVVLSLILTIFVNATALAEPTYMVEIQDDGISYSVSTNEIEAVDILEDNSIVLDKEDHLDISNFQSGEGGVIKIERCKNIYINIDNKPQLYKVYSTTVKDAINECKIKYDSKYQSNYDDEATVEEGMVIEINELYDITINSDGQSIKCKSIKKTVKDLLKDNNISLDTDDYVKPSLDTIITKNSEITVYRVTYKVQTKTETIKYKTEKEKDNSMNSGSSKVKTEGLNGSDNVTYQIKYVNGKEEKRTETARTTIQKPVTKVVIVGTKVNTSVKPNGRTSYNGLTVGETITGRYTHYCACAQCGTGSGMTASGKRVYNGMSDPHYIACNWLPMGSVVSVNGTNYTVVDRGGSGLSSVGRIDIFTPEGHAACYKYGTGSCKLIIQRIGW